LNDYDKVGKAHQSNKKRMDHEDPTM
jgi:hypothetical protein